MSDQTIQIKYVGTAQRWPEISITGRQSVWMPGQIESRSPSEASALLATGLFSTPPVPVTAATGPGGVVRLSAWGRHAATGMLVQKMDNSAADTSVLILSDSTGDESTEWPYLYASAMSASYPMYTVELYQWSHESGGYSAPVIVATGLGVRVLRIYNAAYGGSRIEYIVGGRFNAGVGAIAGPADLVIVNHGHNHRIHTDSDVERRRVPHYLESLAPVLRAHEGCGLLFMTQNPHRDSNEMEPIYRTIVSAASVLDADIADSYALFMGAAKNPALYADNIHPSAMGQSLYLHAVMDAHSAIGGHKPAQSPLSAGGARNLLINGDFSDWTGAHPAGWVGTNLTSEKSASIFESGAYSWKMIAANAGTNSFYATQAVSGELLGALRGGWVTLAARVWVTEESPSVCGRLELQSNSTPGNTTANIYSQTRDCWVWRAISLQLTSANTYLNARLYGNAGSTGGEVYFDRAVLVRGRLPRDII